MAKKKGKGGKAQQSLDPEREAGEIRGLLERGKWKFALERAKALHKRVDSAESAGLLEKAYVGRVAGLRESALLQEASALIEVAVQKFPHLRQELEGERLVLAVRSGSVRELLTEIARVPEPRERARLEDLLRREVTDPREIADCDTLPSDHPLRRAAAAVADAFEAVISRPVSEEEVRLTEVSRRSPFAPWKPLIHAIAAMYAGETERCRELLATIGEESAPARLVPAIETMLDPSATLPNGPSLRLARRVTASETDLRAALRRVLRGVETPDYRLILEGTQLALDCCQRTRPDLTSKLRSRLWHYMTAHGAPFDALTLLFSPPPRKDAEFWLWEVAAHCQQEGDPWTHVFYLEQYRRHALAEKLLKPGTPEEAALYLHMARQLAPIDPYRNEEEARECAKEDADLLETLYDHQTPEIRAAGEVSRGPGSVMLDPDHTFRRAAQCDPQPFIFREWMDWSGGFQAKEGEKRKEEVAELWASLRPGDAEPCLILSEMAEDRGSLTKAMKYLDEGEERNRLDPALRRARLTLWLKAALKHAKGNKPHLALKDLANAQELEAATEGARPLLIEALRAAIAESGGFEEMAKTARENIARFGGDDLFATTLLHLASANTSKTKHKSFTKTPPALPFALAMARIMTLVRDCRLPLQVPPKWRSWLRSGAKNKAFRQAPPQAALALAEWACFHQDDYELAFAAAGAAFHGPALHHPRAFFLRAAALYRSNLTSEWRRPLQCAGTLSKNDPELRQEISAWERHIPMIFHPRSVLTMEDLSPAEIERQLEMEKRRAALPKLELPFPVFSPTVPNRKKKREKTAPSPAHSGANPEPNQDELLDLFGELFDEFEVREQKDRP
ncbi:MAG: hypothetical protein RLY93_01720 [Sumerlaeia bacterium]